MTRPDTTAAATEPVIGTMNAAQFAAAQDATARVLAAPLACHRTRRGAGGRLPAYCGCCGCITRYCNCSCCCQK